MALSDVWMLTFFQRIHDTAERMLGNYFYTSVDATANANTLAAAFTDAVDGMVPLINAIQTPGMHNDSVRVINLGLLSDFADLPVSGSGTDANAETLPVHDAISFTLKINTRAMRPGSKRISGIAEANVVNGIVTQAGMITAIGALEIGLAAEIVDGAATFLPVIVKRIGLPLGDPPYTSYRLPETDGELVTGQVVAALASLKVSHQVSRGNGR